MSLVNANREVCLIGIASLGFSKKCTSALEQIGDEALATEKHGEALEAYATALSLRPSSTNDLSTKWASTILRSRSINEALQSANEVRFTSQTLLRY